MKTYLKDLTLEEIIKRLKNGEIVKVENSKEYFKMIDGVVCRFFDYGNIGISSVLFTEPDDVYFETEEPFEIKEAGLYKTRDGRKVFVSKIYDDYILGLVDGDKELMSWNLNGFVFNDEREDNQNIIGKWED